MSNKKLKLKDIWNLTVREELLTVLWGILTVLLLGSDSNTLYYIGWAAGAWTILCFIGIFKSVWPKPELKKKIKTDEDAELYNQLNMFLSITFSNSDFTEGNGDQRDKIIKTAARRLYNFTQTYKNEG
jgi:hypothetical protein